MPKDADKDAIACLPDLIERLCSAAESGGSYDQKMYAFGTLGQMLGELRAHVTSKRAAFELGLTGHSQSVEFHSSQARRAILEADADASMFVHILEDKQFED